jgi:Fur family peroxide stress response transcriptional regulator
MTPQRQRIFQVLADSTTHPTAEVVYAAVRIDMPTISLRTVYETLNELVELGEIQQFDLGLGARQFDPNIEPHHHLICVSCGMVRDVSADFGQIEIPDELRQGFTVRNTEVSFRGLCEDCSRKASLD